MISCTHCGDDHVLKPLCQSLPFDIEFPSLTQFSHRQGKTSLSSCALACAFCPSQHYLNPSSFRSAHFPATLLTDLEFAIDIECLRQPCLHPANLVFQVDTHLVPRYFHFPFYLIVIATHYVFRPGASVHGSKQWLHVFAC